jgi:hypothetical protein
MYGDMLPPEGGTSWPSQKCRLKSGLNPSGGRSTACRKVLRGRLKCRRSARASNKPLQALRRLQNVGRAAVERPELPSARLSDFLEPIGDLDSLIAAQALARDLIVVTNNVDELLAWRLREKDGLSAGSAARR